MSTDWERQGISCTRIPVPVQPKSPRTKLCLSPVKQVSTRNENATDASNDSEQLEISPLACSIQPNSTSYSNLTQPLSSQLKNEDQNVTSKTVTLPSILNIELCSDEEPEYDSGNLLHTKSNNKDNKNKKTVPLPLQGTQMLLSPEHKSVKFYSPTHQEFESDTYSILPVSMEYEHKKENIIHIPSLGHRDVDSLSSPADYLSDKLSSDVEQSLESLDPTASEISLSSRVSLPVPLRLGNRDTWRSMRPHSLQYELAVANCEDESSYETRLIKQPELKRPSSMPQLSLITSKAHHTEVKKKEIASSDIAMLKSKKKALEDKDIMSKEIIANLENTNKELQRCILVLKAAHEEEMAKLRKENRDELERERQRLLNQMYEISKLKPEVSAKVYKVEDSPGHTKMKLAIKYLVKDKLVNQPEIEALKVEVNALQDLLQETECSHDLLVQVNKDQEIRIGALLAEKDKVIARIIKTSDHSNGIEEYEQNILKMTTQIQELQEKMEVREKVANGNLLLKKKLNELLMDRHNIQTINDSLLYKEKLAAQENQTLKSKLNELQARVVDKAAQMTQLEGHGSNSCLNTPLIEKQKYGVLNAGMDIVNSQLTQERDLAQTLFSERQVPEDVQSHNSQEMITLLMTKVDELQGEVTLQKQQLHHVTSQRDSLLEKVDSLSMQIVTMESEMVKERTKSNLVQCKLELSENENQTKDKELQLFSEWKADLQAEVFSVRKDLKAAKENIIMLETELAVFQTKYENCHDELSNSTTTSSELERHLFSASATASTSQNTIEQLRDMIKDTKEKLKKANDSLALERQTNKKLNSSLDKLSRNLEANKKIESMESENTSLKKDVKENWQDMQKLQQEAQTLRLNLKESKTQTSRLNKDNEKLQQEVKLQAGDLTQTKDSVLMLKQKLAVAMKDLGSTKLEMDRVKNELKNSEAEKVRQSKLGTSAHSEIQDLKAKILFQSQQLTEKEQLLLIKEEELRNIGQEGVTLTTKISEMQKLIQTLSSSQANADKDFSVKLSEMDVDRTRLTECQHALEEKVCELRFSQGQIEDLKQTVKNEKEKNFTLKLELSSTQAEVHDTIGQCTKLNTEMEQKNLDFLNELNHSDRSKAEVEQQLLVCRTKYSELTNHFNLLKLEMEQSSKDTEERMINLRSEIDSLMEELVVVEKNKVDELKSVRHSMNQELEEKHSQLEDAHKDQAIAKSQMKHLSQELDAERAKNIQMQDDMDNLTVESASVSTDLEKSQYLLVGEQSRVESINFNLLKAELKVQELSKQLHETQQQLYSTQESDEESQVNFSKTLTSIKSCHEEERLSLQMEIEQLKMELTTNMENFEAVNQQLETCEEELTACSSKLSQMEQKCAYLESGLFSKSSDHEALETDHIELQSRHAEARMEVADLSEQSLTQATLTKQLKNEVQNTQHDCKSLEEQIKFHRETAATSLNMIQKCNQDKCTELLGKIQDQAEKLREAHTSIRALEHDRIALKTDNCQLNESLVEENEQYSLLTHKLEEITTSLRLSEQKEEQFERLHKMEETAKIMVNQQLQDEVTQRKRAQDIIDKHKQDIVVSAHELGVCQASIISEKAYSEKLKGDLNVSKAEVACLNQRLTSVNESNQTFRANVEKEICSLRQKYHTDKKILKERVRQLQTTALTLSTQSDSRAEEISRVGAFNISLQKEQKLLTKRLSDKNYEIQAKIDECRNLQKKINSLEVQLKQMELELAVLGEAHLEYEQYKKRLEEQSRQDGERILTEVKDCMEQQYTAHRYLESLRAENERISLKDKEFEINQLKSELSRNKKESKQEKWYLRHLQVETRHLKSQQTDQDRSRRRLEARLKQVNDTLSRTMPLPRQSYSYQTSPPLRATTPLLRH